MTSRTRNLTILGIVATLLVLALLVIVPGTPLSKDTKLGLDLEGGIELVYEGEPTPQVPKVTPQAIDDAIETMRKRVDSLGVSEPEIQRAGASQISVGLPDVQNAERAREQVGNTARLQFYDWEPNILTDREVYAGGHALFDAVVAASKQKGKAEANDVPPGSDMTPAQADKANNTAKDRYYLFGPDQLPIGPDKKPLRTGNYEPSGTCKDLLSDYDPASGSPPKYAKDTECLKQLEALGSGGPPAGSRVIKVPEGVVVVEQEPAPNQPPQIQRYTVLEDDSELSGEDIKNPKAGTDPNTNAPLVTMEFTDKGREAFARVTKRIAERGFEQSTLQPGRHRQGAVLPALRDHARQPDRLAGDDRLRLQPRGHRRPHGRPDRERRQLQRRQRPRREPAHRRAADRAQADLGDAGLGDARQAGAPPGPARRAPSA